MFIIKYKVILGDEGEEFWGEEGFFRISGNGNIYGEFYPKALEHIIDKVTVSA